MQLRSDATLPYDRPTVFRAYRDDLLKVVSFLPNVRSIDVRSREDAPPVTRLVNVWHGGGEIPAAARAVLSESMLSWTDHATWDESEWTCAWRIETHAFTDAVRCEGKNRFVEEGGHTRLEIRGELEIDATRIRGVPRILAKTVSKSVTELLANKITPNLLEVSAGLKSYLDGQRG